MNAVNALNIQYCEAQKLGNINQMKAIRDLILEYNNKGKSGNAIVKSGKKR